MRIIDILEADDPYDNEIIAHKQYYENPSYPNRMSPKQLIVTRANREQIKKAGFDAVKPRLEKECSQIVNFYKKYKLPIYRGVSKVGGGMGAGIFKSKIDQNRKPLYMDRKIQDVFDNELQELGFSAVRGNSIFCTTSQGVAGTWGYLNLVFPVDGFKYTWFNVGDDDYTFDHIYKVGEKYLGTPYLNTKMKYLITDKLKPRKTRLYNAVSIKKAEILITCPYYYAISWHDYLEELNEWLGISAK